MTDDPDDTLDTPLTPTAVDGRVRVVDPPPAAMNLTPDAAEVSGIRMLDAADRARDRTRGRK